MAALQGSLCADHSDSHYNTAAGVQAGGNVARHHDQPGLQPSTSPWDRPEAFRLCFSWRFPDCLQEEPPESLFCQLLSKCTSSPGLGELWQRDAVACWCGDDSSSLRVSRESHWCMAVALQLHTPFWQSWTSANTAGTGSDRPGTLHMARMSFLLLPLPCSIHDAQ